MTVARITEISSVSNAQITCKVEYREGDGSNIAIRRGPVEGQTTPTDATPSWVHGETHGSAAMPFSDYQSCLAKGLIALRTSPR